MYLRRTCVKFNFPAAHLRQSAPPLYASYTELQTLPKGNMAYSAAKSKEAFGASPTNY